jgi:dipeptidyl aminopeptidase/acylaminoacyl peptidase
MAPGERRHLYPVAMADGEHFIYVAFNPEVTRGTVYYASLTGAEAQRLYEGGLSRVAFAPPDTLLVAEEVRLGVATLRALRFDTSTGRVTAPPVELLRDIGVGVVVDRAGSLIVPEAGLRRYRFAWHEPTGIAHPVPGGDASVFTFDLSPDGRRLAYMQQFVGLFVRDLDRGVSTPLLSVETGAQDPVWSPDGRQIAYGFNRGDRQGVAAMAADGGAERVLLDSTPIRTFLDDWSSDGRYLAGHQRGSDSRGVIIPVGDAGASPLVFATASKGRGIDEPRFSPDVRWLAYNAHEGVPDQVFIVPVPPTGERIQVSTAGGAQPRWSRDGRSLYFLAPNGDLMRVAVTAEGTRLRLSAPDRVFATGIAVRSDIDQYAVGPDGRFLLRLPADDDAPQQLRVIHNWRALLVPAAQ